MEKDLLQLLSRLDENEENIISIPELDLKAHVKDSLMTALLLLPLFKHQIHDRLRFKKTPTDKKRVGEICAWMDKLNKDDVSYIAIIGKKAEEAYMHLEHHIGHAFLDEGYSVVRGDHQIYVPIREKGYEPDDLKALSAMGVTVLDLYDGRTVYYVEGREVFTGLYDLMPHIHFVTHMGFTWDEYVFAEILYHLGRADEAYQTLMLDHLDTTFVQSLLEMVELPGGCLFEKGHALRRDTEEEERHPFADLIGMLETLDFDAIKDRPFSFVRRYMYDPDPQKPLT